VRARIVHGLDAHALGQHDTREVGRELEAPVLAEDPVQAVVVVAHARHERDDQLAAAASLVVVDVDVEVLPEHAAVALVDRDGVLGDVRLAEVVDEVGVEQDRVVGRVPALLQLAREAADAVLADVKALRHAQALSGSP
jgi:hypothetical protein